MWMEERKEELVRIRIFLISAKIETKISFWTPYIKKIIFAKFNSRPKIFGNARKKLTKNTVKFFLYFLKLLSQKKR